MSPTTPSCNRDAIASAPMQPSLRAVSDLHWRTDVEAHVDSVNKIFHNALKTHCPKKKNGPKKAFMSDELWSMRRLKLRLKKQVHSYQRTLGRDFLTNFFLAWKKHTDAGTYMMSTPAVACPFECSLRCRSLRVGAQLWRHGHALKTQLHKAKKQALADQLQRLT